MNKMIRWCTAIVVLLSAPVGYALTYQPMLDDDLLDQSPLVVRGKVLSRDDISGAASNVTSYQLSVLRVYKGELPVNEITVTVPGNPMPGARKIPGAPQLAENSEVVLFLAATSQGDYRLVHLPLGAFTAKRDINGQSIFVRQLADSRALPVDVPGRSAINEAPRSAENFLGWLGDPEAEYEASTLNMGPGGTTQKDEFTTLGSPPSRWWQFDDSVSVSVKAHSSGQPGMTGGGFTRFQAGIAAWTNDSGSNVRYTYGGTTTASGGLNTPDSVNTILFNDPNGEVEGTFTCDAGGVLAIGGFVTSGTTRTFQNQLFGEIVEGDIVTNNGAGCFFGMGNNSNGEEVFAHELGHTLGLGHSCEESGTPIIGLPLDPDSCSAATSAERDALMKATPHADGRGASLRADDKAGIAFLYPNQGGSVTPEPEPEPEPGNEPQPAAGGGGGGGGGGCAMATGVNSVMDSSLLLLLLLSAGLLCYRRVESRRH